MAQFVEVQSYGWLFNTIVGIVFLGILLFFWRFLEKKVYILGFIPFVFLIAYFMIERLETRIDNTGIHYQMFPAQLTEQNIAWNEVYYIDVKDYVL